MDPGTAQQETPASVARSKVLLQSQQVHPTVSTPIDVDALEKELCNHPNRIFVNSLIKALRHGTNIGYTGPQTTRVSKNFNLCFSASRGCFRKLR